MPPFIIGRQGPIFEIKGIAPLKSLEIDLYNQHSLHASAKTGLLNIKSLLAPG